MLATSIFSILGECSGNVRSTPTPKDCLRTVKVSRSPAPWRLMQTPSNTWIRCRWPSITLKWTLTVSPALNAGTSRSWRASMSWIAVTTEDGTRRPSGSQIRTGGRPGLTVAPRRHRRVIARDQHLRHLPAAEVTRARVMGILDPAAQPLRERLLAVALLLAQRAGELAGHRVDDRHRRHLAAGEDVWTDRDQLGREVVEHPLVEPLVAAAEQAQRTLGRSQLGRHRVVEAAAPRRQRDHPHPLPHLVDRCRIRLLERRADHVDADHHAGTAAVGCVVDLAVTAERE